MDGNTRAAARQRKPRPKPERRVRLWVKPDGGAPGVVRITVGGIDADDLPELLEEIGEETNAVFGDFDILTCVAAGDVAGVLARIFELRGIGAVASTMTLWIIDYVCAGEDAPKAYRRRMRDR